MTNLVSADSLQETADFAMDHFGPGWKDKPAIRRIVEALVDAEAAVRTFEDAAIMRTLAERQRAKATTLRAESVGSGGTPALTESVSALAQRLCGIPEDEDDEPARMRKVGAL